MAGEESSDWVSYKEKLNLLRAKLKLDASKEQKCGGFLSKLVSTHTFLSHDPETSIVSIIGSKKQAVSQFKDAYVLITLGTNKWKVPITITFLECKIE